MARSRSRFKEKKEKPTWTKEKAITGRFYRIEKDIYSENQYKISSFKGTLVGDVVFVYSAHTSGVRKISAASAFRSAKAAMDSVKLVDGFHVESNEHYTSKLPIITKVKVQKKANGELVAFSEEGKTKYGPAFLTRSAAVKFLLKHQDKKISEERSKFAKRAKEHDVEMRQRILKRKRTAAMLKSA